MQLLKKIHAKDIPLWKWLVSTVVIVVLMYNHHNLVSFQNYLFSGFFDSLSVVFKPVNLNFIKTYFVFFFYIIVLLVLLKTVHKNDFKFNTSLKSFRLFYFIISTFLFSFFISLFVTIEFFISQEEYSFQFNLLPFIELIIAVSIAIPIKIFFYELFFRTYMLHFLKRLIKKRWLLVIISGVFFALGAFKFNISFTNELLHPFIYVTYAGIILTVLVLLSDGVEMSIGMLVGNELMSTILISHAWYELPTDALFVNNSTNVKIFVNYYLPLIGFAFFVFLIINIFEIKDWKRRILY